MKIHEHTQNPMQCQVSKGHHRCDTDEHFEHGKQRREKKTEYTENYRNVRRSK